MSLSYVNRQCHIVLSASLSIEAISHVTHTSAFNLFLKVKFVMSDETNLADLLALNLHLFEDEVRNIVDKASKELSMEKTLKELAVTWGQMEFTHDRHTRTAVMLLTASEELIETLEDNQVSWCLHFSC